MKIKLGLTRFTIAINFAFVILSITASAAIALDTSQTTHVLSTPAASAFWLDSISQQLNTLFPPLLLLLISTTLLGIIVIFIAASSLIGKIKQ